jgi:hypothetical protein
MLGAVRDALGRRSVALSVEGSVPAAASAVGEGWRLAWAVGALAWYAGAGLARDGRVRVAFARPSDGAGERDPAEGERAWDVTFAPPPVERPELAAARARIDRELPGARLVRTDEALTLRVPEDWLVARADQRT